MKNQKYITIAVLLFTVGIINLFVMKHTAMNIIFGILPFFVSGGLQLYVATKKVEKQ